MEGHFRLLVVLSSTVDCISIEDQDFNSFTVLILKIYIHYWINKKLNKINNNK